MARRFVVLNARVWTGTTDRWAEAFLVEDGRIRAVGPEARVLRRTPTATRRRDLGGRLVLPGLIDAHTHLVHQGLLQQRPDLAGARDRDEALERVRRAARRHRGRGPLLAERWDESGWRDHRWPTREELDAITTRFPLVLRRVDGHVAVANTKAVRLLEGRLPGVDARRGLLLEDASLYLNRVWPTPVRQVALAVRRGVEMALGLGLAGVHDFVTAGYARSYARVARRGRLRLRVTATPYAGPGWRGRPVPSDAGPMLQAGGVKLFADGSLGAHTAALSAPYADEEGTGRLLFTDRQVATLIGEAARAGRQPCVHAIGDLAIDQVLGAYARLPARVRRRVRPRIEHAELIRGDQLDRAKDLGVVLSMQPNFLGAWCRPGGLYERRLGARMRRSNPFRDVVRAGVPLAFGSDCMPLDPWLGLRRAVGAPEARQRLPIAEALRCYTFGSAFAQGQEAEVGVLAPGSRADFLVLEGTLASLASRQPGHGSIMVGGAWTAALKKPPGTPI